MTAPAMTQDEARRQRQSVDDLCRHLEREKRKRRIKRFFIDLAISLVALAGTLALVYHLTKG